MLLLRAAEAAGLGLLAASGLALGLMAVLMYHDRPALAVLAVLMPVGLGAGLTWAWWRRPSIVAVAIEADRQLRLQELLSTAWALRSAGREDPPARAVLFAADDAAARIAPAQLVLHRLGVRAWGGIGLTAALAIALGLVSANPLSTSAAPHSRGVVAAIAQRQVDPAADQSASATPGRAADLPDHAPQSDEALHPAGQNGSPAAQGEAPDSGQSLASAEGAGGGSARSADSGAPRASPPAASDAPREIGMDGSPVAGGAAARQGVGREGRSGSAAAAAGSGQAPPPWISPNWPDAVRSADMAIRSGRIPLDYHDLIRDYFER